MSEDENSYKNQESPRSDDGYQSRKEPSYEYQEPYDNDKYGNPHYDTYKERYAYQNPTGRDHHGNPTYN